MTKVDVLQNNSAFTKNKNILKGDKQMNFFLQSVISYFAIWL